MGEAQSAQSMMDHLNELYYAYRQAKSESERLRWDESLKQQCNAAFVACRQYEMTVAKSEIEHFYEEPSIDFPLGRFRLGSPLDDYPAIRDAIRADLARIREEERPKSI